MSQARTRISTARIADGAVGRTAAQVLRLSAILGYFLLFLGAAAYADTKTEGEIAGIVMDPEGQPLPGATVTLSGDQLIQKSITQVTNARGAYRFPALKPGSYSIVVSLPGFGEHEATLTVNVGKTTSADVRLGLARTTQDVVVRGTSLIDKTTPQISTNYTDQTLRQIPVGRNREFVELMDSTAGINDRGGAYGTGGWYDPETIDAKFERGSPSSSYQLNGVDVSNLEYGTTPINPDLDTLEEVQILGPGASAEYGSFTGAVVNLVTKSGTNQYHGSVSAFYSSGALESDNSGGVPDLERGELDYAFDGTATLGGPIVREKLLFFGAVGGHPSSQAPPQSDAFSDSRRVNYQLRVDFLASPSQKLSAMIARDPIEETNLGVQAGGGEEIGYFYDARTDTAFASWQATWGQHMLTELKYAGFKNYTLRQPNSPDVPGINDGRTGRQYNSAGFGREFRNSRNQGMAQATRYVDEFLNTSHEIKAGFEYEQGRNEDYAYATGNSFLYLFPLGTDETYVGGALYNGTRAQATIQTITMFVQDKVIVSPRLTVNVGLRYDNPRMEENNVGAELADFHTLAPRLGATYDLTGDGSTLVQASYGRYYDQALTYSLPFFGGYGSSPAHYYSFTTTDPVDPLDPTLPDRLFQPANFSYTYQGSRTPIDPNLKNSLSDVWLAGLERSFGGKFAISARYIYKDDGSFIVLQDQAPHTYEPFPYTDPVTGNELTLYTQTDSNPIDYILTNDDFYFRKHHIAILEARTQASARLFLQSSVTWERNTGNIENDFTGIGGFGGVNASNNPNFRDNPFNEGVLTFDRTWQVKLLAAYKLPIGFYVSGDFRFLSGRAWTPVQAAFFIPGFNDPTIFGSSTILLAERGSERWESSKLLNLRVGKAFRLGPGELEGTVDVTNVLNDDSPTEIYNYPTAIYPLSQENAYGKPQRIQRPRQVRFGLRYTF